MTPSDWKPVKTVGPGVNEIRIHTELEHRIFYVVRFPEAIYVLHAFEKRTRQTRQADIDLAKNRLAELTRLRRKTKER
jgi:phage-related protein